MSSSWTLLASVLILILRLTIPSKAIIAYMLCWTCCNKHFHMGYKIKWS